MAHLSESNEYFNCTVYPVGQEEKNGITLRSEGDEYNKAAECIRIALGKKDARERKAGRWTFKVTQLRIMKGEVRAQIVLKEQGPWNRFQLQVHNSGTIQISKVKGHPLEAGMSFAREVLIPQVEGLIKQIENDKEKEQVKKKNTRN